MVMTKLIQISDNLFQDLRSLIIEARQDVARQVNSALVLLYWQVGKRIRQDILKEKRADYGEQIVATLSQQLVSEFGSNFSTRNLWHMLRFAEVFPDEKIVNALSTQLGWTHFRQIITFGIRVAAYLTELPPRKLLQKKLHEAILLARARLEGKNGEQGKTEILS